MSSNIQISGPFIKAIYSSFYDDGRSANNPVYAAEPTFQVPVPVPFRRINTIIQNQGTEAVLIGLGDGVLFLTGGAGIKLFAGQTISLDNYNGPITIVNGGAEGTTLIVISESFA
jgi:hypothetical protein